MRNCWNKRERTRKNVIWDVEEEGVSDKYVSEALIELNFEIVGKPEHK